MCCQRGIDTCWFIQQNSASLDNSASCAWELPILTHSTNSLTRVRVRGGSVGNVYSSTLRPACTLLPSVNRPWLLMTTRLSQIGRIDAAANSTKRCPSSAPPCVQHTAAVAHARLSEARAKFKRLRGDWLGAFRAMSALLELCRRCPRLYSHSTYMSAD